MVLRSLPPNLDILHHKGPENLSLQSWLNQRWPQSKVPRSCSVTLEYHPLACFTYTYRQEQNKIHVIGKGLSQFASIQGQFLNQAVVQKAIEACYSLLATVQQLWRKVSTEDDDDYIANPKPSGYQSLHTAVIGMLLLLLSILPYIIPASMICICDLQVGMRRNKSLGHIPVGMRY